MRCAESVREAPDFEDFAYKENAKYLPNDFQKSIVPWLLTLNNIYRYTGKKIKYIIEIHVDCF